MRLVKDPASFAEPLDRAIEEAVGAVTAAGSPVRGAENRVALALRQLRDLQAFDRRVQALLAQGDFASLPRFLLRGQVMPHCHKLAVGVWRGVFLVDPEGELVVGLLFSKEPHALDDRLDELVRKYAPASDDRNEDS